MHVKIAAVGRARSSPEQDLLDHYTKLIRGQGPAAGITSFEVKEIDDRKAPSGEARRHWETKEIRRLCPDGAVLVVLDERGKSLSSTAFAQRLGAWCDNGTSELVFSIGGPDGHSDAIREQAALMVAFGPATWPHMLARVMLSEQIYRAISIINNHPYHRA